MTGRIGTEPPRRQARGERRRREIAEAALRIVEREGLDGVTHRHVAAEAGVPLAATTYYFASKEELMEAAMAILVEREAAELARLGDAIADRELTVDEALEALVAYYTWLWREQRVAQISQFELFLRVAHDDRERPSWVEPYLAVARGILERIGSSDPERDAETVVALINGLALHQLTAPRPDFEQTVLRSVLRGWLDSALGA